MRHIRARSIRKRSLVFSSRLLGSNKAAREVTRLGSSRDRRFPAVSRGEQLRITTSCLDVPPRARPHTLLLGAGLFGRGRPPFPPDITAIEANVTIWHISHRSGIGIVFH